MESALLREIGGYLEGGWIHADSGQTLEVINPATGAQLAAVPDMGAAETLRAIESAARLLGQTIAVEQRTTWLARIADLLCEHRAELGRLITAEHGKPWRESQQEVDYAASFFRFYAGQMDHLAPQRLPHAVRGHHWTVHYRPAGVAALITPWNFPLAMLAKKMSAALAAGCPCVVKPSSKTPLTMIGLFHLLDTLRLPPGLVNLVIGRSEPIGRTFCRHPDVRILSFTGSTEVGRELATRAAAQLKRVSLELGGNAPCLVFADADLELAVEQIVQNKFRASGQTCVCVNRVLVERQARVPFVAMLRERMSRLRCGDGMDPDTDLGPLIDANGWTKAYRHWREALDQGAACLLGGPDRESALPAGNYFPPTLLTHVTDNMLCMREETFGPIVPVADFDAEAEAVQRANQTEYGLAAYLFTSDARRAERILAQLRCGHVGWNSGAGPTAEAPFGGWKSSGMGREGGQEGLHEYLETQTVPEPLPICLPPADGKQC